MNPTSERAAGGRVWSVGGLIRMLDDTMAARFGTVRVCGELSALTEASSGHRYFSLKDADGQAALLRCALFRRAGSQLAFALRNGLKVEAIGRLTVYEPRGDLQFVVESVTLLGAGSLHEEFLRLKARLGAEGWFDSARKRPLPEHPRRIGVVSSLAAAALRDVLTIVARRAPHVEVRVFPCLVQGEAAPPTIVSALQAAAERGEVEVIILARGGGSLEDLWAFNDERVVRAVAQSPVPVVCGVGHETDVTLADFSADVRAPTPTAAGELATPVRDDERDALQERAHRLSMALHRVFDRQTQRLDQMALMVLRPAQTLAHQAHALERLQDRLAAAWREPLRLAHQRLERSARRLMQGAAQQGQSATARLRDVAARLESQDPRRVLQRGYAWVSDEAGVPVTSAGQVRPGQSVRAVWHDGQAQVRVEQVSSDPP